MQGPMPPSDPAPQGSRKGRRYPAGAAPRAAPQSLPPSGGKVARRSRDGGGVSFRRHRRKGPVWDSPLRYAANPGTAGGGRPPLQRTEGELCTIQGPLPHRAAHPDGAGHRSPCSTETRPRSPSYPSPQNCQQAEGSRPPPASLFPITWACRCTAGHSTTDGSA